MHTHATGGAAALMQAYMRNCSLLRVELEEWYVLLLLQEGMSHHRRPCNSRRVWQSPCVKGSCLCLLHLPPQ